MRIAYSEPNWFAEPTPGMRWIGSSTCEATMLLSSAGPGRLGVVDCSAMTPRNPALALAIADALQHSLPRGRRGSASVTRFCVCTAAMSGSVPFSNVSVICALPSELDVEVKYSRRSMPVSCCSMTCVTVRFDGARRSRPGRSR